MEEEKEVKMERNDSVRESDMEVDQDEDENPFVELQDTNSAFTRCIREFEIINFGYKDIERFLLNAFKKYKPEVMKAVTQF